MGNWAERYRVFAHEDVVALQSALEEPLFEAQVGIGVVPLGTLRIYSKRPLHQVLLIWV